MRISDTKLFICAITFFTLVGCSTEDSNPVTDATSGDEVVSQTEEMPSQSEPMEEQVDEMAEPSEEMPSQSEPMEEQVDEMAEPSEE